MTIEGVDYASVDGNHYPDFVTARAAGLSFAIIRGAYTYGSSVLPDAHLARDRNTAQVAGLRVGAYLIVGYGVGGPSPEDQAHAFIAAYGARRPNEFPVALDAETNSNDRSSTTDAWRLAWLERAYDVLKARYGLVMTYTSADQWATNFGDKDSRLGDGPLWIKMPYPWKEHNPPHPQDCPAVGVLPRPWRRTDSPGAWIEQYQGDAIGSPGFSATVDLNRFLPYVDDGRPDARTSWMHNYLRARGMVYVTDLQQFRSRVADKIVGPSTFCDL